MSEAEHEAAGAGGARHAGGGAETSGSPAQQATPGPPQYPPGPQPGDQPQYHPQPVAHGQGGYGYGYPYPGPAMAAPAYYGAYVPYQAAGYPPAGYPAYSAGAMPHPMSHQGAPMGAHAAGMAGAGQGAGPGPQAGMQQLFEELAEGGNGLNTLTRMLSLDDTEFWKGALVGAAAVLLLTNDQVQDALFKSGAKAKGAMKSGADKLKERMSTASEKEGDA